MDCSSFPFIVGFVGIRDDVRPEAKQAIEEVQNAGIQVVMITGDRKETAVDLKIDVSELIGRVKHNYKRKNSWVRNQVTLLIRKIRKEKPYKIQDYSKAKELYDSRTPIDLSKVKVGSYVYKISREVPVKGKRWCEYHINESGTEGIYKVHKKDNYLKHEYFSLENYDGNWNHFTTLSKKSLRSFRFATKEEIEQFKIARKNYKQKKKEIDTLQKQISKLYKEL